MDAIVSGTIFYYFELSVPFWFLYPSYEPLLFFCREEQRKEKNGLVPLLNEERGRHIRCFVQQRDAKDRSHTTISHGR